ncbi:MAG: hypothetical protein KZQ96_18670 [Candidatus Thiodiazotropha sp. (ex Lucinoma borealis)]|nr:hypothetical protein [Candidatus Thiodiazotropha sp. (ex Lucinoma borealis)]MCU7855583.1 hypothetical protein [Candidatus Thiodiazotropha sp. (ex Lucinoma borealis)]MCU7869894.1 hypothetical protein [Candidatus Thiodiazotropha sp. (ex Lucinoma borealis)]
MHEQIVRKLPDKDVTTGDSVYQTTDHVVEPSLLPQPSQLLPSFPVSDWSDAFSQYLIKRVRRNPRDLRAHVQRTLLYLSQRDSEAIYAALIDLFLILGSRGHEIRKNLLRQARSLLPEERYRFLKARMKTGLDTKERLPPNTFSSLSRGLSGTTNIVSRKGSDPNSSPVNPLDQAMERYRQNDWLTAMIILENALNDDPGDEAVCRELLSLYKKHHARDAFYKTFTGIFGRCFALPELWRDTERFFHESAQ